MTLYLSFCDTGPAQSAKQQDVRRQALLAKKQKIQQQKEMARQRAEEFAGGQNIAENLPVEQRLSQPRMKAPPAKGRAKETEGDGESKIEQNNDVNINNQNKEEERKENETAAEVNECNVKELNEEEAMR